MSPAQALLHKLLDVVVATDLDDPSDDFVSVGLAVLSLAISKLPPAEREDILDGLECGALRRAVEMFPRQQTPHDGRRLLQ